MRPGVRGLGFTPPGDNAPLSRPIPPPPLSPSGKSRRHHTTLSLSTVVGGAGLGGFALAHWQAEHPLESDSVHGDEDAGIKSLPMRRDSSTLGDRFPPVRYGFLCLAHVSGLRMHQDRDFIIQPHPPARGLPRLAFSVSRAHPPRRTVRDMQPDPALSGGLSITLASGAVLHADVIVGADGVKSTL